MTKRPAIFIPLQSKSTALGIVMAGILAGGHVANAGQFELRHTDSGIDIISVTGELVSGDEDHFRRIAVGSDSAVVVLNSPGGSLLPSIEIGKTIQIKGFSTYVPAKAVCTSSCALIWVAGSTRMMASDASVGFHASYRDNNGRLEETGVGNAVVGRYLTLLNLPEKAVVFATSASPTSILWLNKSNSERAGISFDILDLKDDTPPPPKIQINQAPAVGNAVSSNFKWNSSPWMVWEDGKGCFVAEVFGSEDGKSNTSSIAISVDYRSDTALLLVMNEKFRSIKDGEIYPLAVNFFKGQRIDSGWGTLKFTGYKSDETLNGVSVRVNRKSILEDFKSSSKVHFYRNDTLVDSYALDGSFAAVGQLEKCLALAENASLPDPFSN